MSVLFSCAASIVNLYSFLRSTHRLKASQQQRQQLKQRKARLVSAIFYALNNIKIAEGSRKRADKLPPLIDFLYKRVCEMIGNFAELTRFQTLTETTLHNLCSLGTPVFFIDGISEMQIEGTRLLTNLFHTVTESNFRRAIIQELLESLHRLPSNKNHRNCYRLSETVWISNFVVLVLNLLQSVIKVRALYCYKIIKYFILAVTGAK